MEVASTPPRKRGTLPGRGGGLLNRLIYPFNEGFRTVLSRFYTPSL